MPANVQATDAFYGRGWRWSWGYRETGKTCLAVKLPANGYLSDAPYGPGWKCMRGFKAVENTCIPVEIPANGHLSDASFRPCWICNRGFSATETACIALQVPENAHRNYSGNNWEYNLPYLKRTGVKRCSWQVHPDSDAGEICRQWRGLPS